MSVDAVSHKDTRAIPLSAGTVKKGDFMLTVPPNSITLHQRMQISLPSSELKCFISV